MFLFFGLRGCDVSSSCAVLWLFVLCAQWPCMLAVLLLAREVEEVEEEGGNALHHG